MKKTYLFNSSTSSETGEREEFLTKQGNSEVYELYSDFESLNVSKHESVCEIRNFQWLRQEEKEERTRLETHILL